MLVVIMIVFVEIMLILCVCVVCWLFGGMSLIVVWLLLMWIVVMFVLKWNCMLCLFSVCLISFVNSG